MDGGPGDDGGGGIMDGMMVMVRVMTVAMV
jgi:hypothetical protein